MRKSRFSSKLRKKEYQELDITSLLDILVILLVFLLKSYNASDLKLSLAKGITLPSSISERLGEHTTIIQVNKDRKIWVNNKLISETPFDLNSLDQKLKEIKLKHKDNSNQFVNLVFDQMVVYSEMQKIMNVAASNGGPQFKFIVKGNY